MNISCLLIWGCSPPKAVLGPSADPPIRRGWIEDASALIPAAPHRGGGDAGRHRLRLRLRAGGAGGWATSRLSLVGLGCSGLGKLRARRVRESEWGMRTVDVCIVLGARKSPGTPLLLQAQRQRLHSSYANGHKQIAHMRARRGVPPN